MAFLRSLLHLVIAIAVLAQPVLAERVGCCCSTNRKAETCQRLATSSPNDGKVAAGCPRCRAKIDRQTARPEQSLGHLKKDCRCISLSAPAVTQDRKPAAVEMPAKTRAENVTVRLLSVLQPDAVRANCSGVKLSGRELRVWHCSWLA